MATLDSMIYLFLTFLSFLLAADWVLWRQLNSMEDRLMEAIRERDRDGLKGLTSQLKESTDNLEQAVENNQKKE